MAKKKQEPDKKKKIDTSGVVGLVGSTQEQPVTETLEVNYMPYAMSISGMARETMTDMA